MFDTTQYHQLNESLEAFLDAPVLEQQTREPFVIDTPEKADWAVRKILAKQQYQDSVKGVAAERIQQVQIWEKQELDEAQQSIDFLAERLRPYVAQQLDGKKTLKMPSGNISFRAASPEFYIEGEKVDGKNQVLLEHIKKNAPEYIKLQESTDWAKFKKDLMVTSTGQVVNTNGEILSFMAAVQQPDKITVKGR